MRIVGWTRFENRREKKEAKARKRGKKKSVGVSAERGTSKGYEEAGGRDPDATNVCWWVRQRACDVMGDWSDKEICSQHRNHPLSGIGCASVHFVCLRVCEVKEKEGGEREWQKEVSVSSLKMYPFSYLWNSQQHLANDFSLIPPPHKQNKGCALVGSGGCYGPSDHTWFIKTRG